MNREFHAHFSFALKDSSTQAFAIDTLVGKRSDHPTWHELTRIRDDIAAFSILTQALITPYKEQARMGTRREVGGLKYWIEGRSKKFLHSRLKFMAQLLNYTSHKTTVSSPLPNLSLFPSGSWALQITFKLRKPYISKDDKEFYILDNPIKKEWVFKVPYVAPSQWKGALRAAMRRLRGYTTWAEEAQDDQMVRLFGNVKGEEEEFSAGRLHFYPTFFDRIGLEVINPHDRKTGAGKQPIYFECVPAGTYGTFALLYVPLDLIGRREDVEEQAKEDLRAVAEGIRAMLTKYGFGAKTSSGYGVVEKNLAKGELLLHLSGTQVQRAFSSLNELARLPEEYLNVVLDTKTGGRDG